MTTQINSYLHLGGKCREAMTFYRDCIGGTLTLQSVEDSPMAGQWPANVQQQILHASLVKESLVLLASDMTDGEPVKPGNDISLALNCASAEEMRTYFSALAQGASITHPIHEFFAGWMGNLTDKFGVSWMFYAPKTDASETP